MGEVFCGRCADDIWGALYEAVCTRGQSQEGRGGKASELMHVLLTLDDPKQKWVTVRNPAINPAFALAELMWIANGRDESDVINFWNSALPRYAGSAARYHGAYGARIRRHCGFDQLVRAWEVLSADPESRQVVIQIYDSAVDFPREDGSPADDDIPCNVCSMVKVRNGLLEWTQVMRSNDLVMGLPYNLVQYTGLQEILAGWLGIGVGTYTHYSDSCHVYGRDSAISCLQESPYDANTDSISVSKGDFDAISSEIYSRMRRVACGHGGTGLDLTALARLESGHPAYDNIMLIVAADAARRLGHDSLAHSLADECGNGLYRCLWKSWARHRDSGRGR